MQWIEIVNIHIYILYFKQEGFLLKFWFEFVLVLVVS
jgi:hypothetical protein